MRAHPIYIDTEVCLLFACTPMYKYMCVHVRMSMYVNVCMCVDMHTCISLYTNSCERVQFIQINACVYVHFHECP